VTVKYELGIHFLLLTVMSVLVILPTFPAITAHDGRRIKVK
jgi:hypothetical protein